MSEDLDRLSDLVVSLIDQTADLTREVAALRAQREADKEQIVLIRDQVEQLSTILVTGNHQRPVTLLVQESSMRLDSLEHDLLQLAKKHKSNTSDLEARSKVLVFQTMSKAFGPYIAALLAGLVGYLQHRGH